MLWAISLPVAALPDPDQACLNEDASLIWPINLRDASPALLPFLHHRAGASPTTAPQVWVQRAWLRAHLGQGAPSLDGVSEAFDALAENDPDRRLFLWLWGWAALNATQPGLAIDLFGRTAEIGPEQPCWLAGALALAYWLDGREAIALDWYSRAALDNPDLWARADEVRYYTRHWQPRLRTAAQQLHSSYLAVGEDSRSPP